MVSTVANGTPDRVGDTGNSWGHELLAVEGRFNDLVWRCMECDVVRTKKQHYENVACE